MSGPPLPGATSDDIVILHCPQLGQNHTSTCSDFCCERKIHPLSARRLISAPSPISKPLSFYYNHKHASCSSSRWQYRRSTLRPVHAIIRLQVQGHQTLSHHPLPEIKGSRCPHYSSWEAIPRCDLGAGRITGHPLGAPCGGNRREGSSPNGNPTAFDRGGGEGAQSHGAGPTAVLEEGRGQETGPSSASRGAVVAREDPTTL